MCGGGVFFFSKVVCICTLNKFPYNGFAVADAWNKEKYVHRNSGHVKLVKPKGLCQILLPEIEFKLSENVKFKL